MAAKAKKTYRIECGNSTTGVVGAVAYVEATSPKAAKDRLLEELPLEGVDVEMSDGIVLRVYFSDKDNMGFSPNRWGKPEETD